MAGVQEQNVQMFLLQLVKIWYLWYTGPSSHSRAELEFEAPQARPRHVEINMPGHVQRRHWSFNARTLQTYSSKLNGKT